MPHQINSNNSWLRQNHSSPTHHESSVTRKKNKLVIGRHRSSPQNAVNIQGVILTGIEPRLINKAWLNVTAPLQQGAKKLKSPNGTIRFVVQPDTTATICVHMAKNLSGKLIFKTISLNFSHSITIKNPSSSLQSSDRSSLSNAIKDKIADVTIKNVVIDENGQVIIDGAIRALGIIKKQLPNHITTVDLPQIDLDFLAGIGVAGNEAKASSKLPRPEVDLKVLLAGLGAVLKQSSYELSLWGDSSQISFFKKDTQFKGQMSPLEIHVKGAMAIDKHGNFIVNVNAEKSAIKSSLGTYIPQVTASVKPKCGSLKASVLLDAKIIGAGQEFRVDMFSRKAVKDMMPRRRLEKTAQDEMHEHQPFNSSVGAEKVDIQASVQLKAGLDKSIQHVEGALSVTTQLHNPYSKVDGRGVLIDGLVQGKFLVHQLSYQQGQGVFVTEASGDISLEPSAKTQAQFPEIKPVVYPYELGLGPDKQASMSPPEYGLSRLVRPIVNFEGHQERVDGQLTKGPLYPIASIDYLKHVEQITGAKARHATTLKLLVSGEESLKARLLLIEQAQDYICFQTLVFKNDEAGMSIAHALVRAAQRGVKVYCIVDSLGNIESIKDLEGEHPIYQYLIGNGVKLKLYNGFVEEGLRAIFSLTKKYPHVFQIENPKSLKSIDHMLKFFERVIEVAQDKTSILSNQERSTLKHALHRIFDGKEGVSPEIAVSELREILLHKEVKLTELFSLIKRVGKASYRWHEKYLVVDHNKAVVGGRNTALEYLGDKNTLVTLHGKEQPIWHDIDVSIEGEAACESYRSFRRNWLHIAQEKLEASPKIKKLTELPESGFLVSMIQHRPLEDGDHNVVNYLLYNLRTLQPGEKAWFETAYFLPRGILRVLQKELVKAAKRGVDVRIVTNSESTSDFSALVNASTFDMRELLKAGARVFVRNDERMVHAKVMVLGDRLTMIGSWNMDNRSASHDSEDMACIYDQEINQQMVSVLLHDMMECSREISPKDIQKRKFSQEVVSAMNLLAAEIV